MLILRNPADRAFSLWARLRSAGFEPLPTFERALAAEDRRYGSIRFARTCPQYFWNYLYFRSGLFGEQVARYFDRYPRDRFYVTTLYQLTADPARVTGEIHDFLGVPRQPVTELPRLEAMQGIRSTAVEVLNRKYVLPLAARSTPGAGRFRARLAEWNRAAPPTLRPETRAALLDRYLPDLGRLLELTGLDVLADEQARRVRAGPGSSSPTA